MKVKILPKTCSGKWAAALLFCFFIFAAAGSRISDIIGNTIEYPNPFNSPLLGTVIYLTFIAAIAASVMGLTSVIKYGERSILVYLSIPLGIFFLLGILMLLAGVLSGQ